MHLPFLSADSCAIKFCAVLSCGWQSMIRYKMGQRMDDVRFACCQEQAHSIRLSLRHASQPVHGPTSYSKLQLQRPIGVFVVWLAHLGCQAV